VATVTDDQVAEDDGALFGVPELHVDVDDDKTGRAEAALYRSLQAGAADGTLHEVDAALAAAALVAARGLDAAERGSQTVTKAGQVRNTGPQPYAIAALLTPYRDALHALRLPTAIVPADSVPLPGNGQTDLSQLLGEHFGTAE
jgi:hypothetical protein